MQPDPAPAPLSSLDAAKEKVLDQIKTVFDPEIPVNIYELGLIYRVELTPEGDRFKVAVDMTLTTPNCPVAGTLPGMVQGVIEYLAEVAEAEVNVVWEPVWTKDMMSEAAKLQLNML